MFTTPSTTDPLQLGLAIAFPGFETALTKQLIPATEAQFYQAGTSCFCGDVVLFARQNTSSYFYDGDNIITEPTIAKYFRSNAQMGLHGMPSMPLFVYKAVADEVSPIADTDALVEQFCNDGVSITYVRDYAGEHFQQAAISFPDVINFLRARFASVPISGCCIRNEFLDVLDPGAQPYLGSAIVNELANIAGVPVGPHHF